MSSPLNHSIRFSRMGSSAKKENVFKPRRDPVSLTPQNYLSPLNRLAQLSLSKSHSKHSRNRPPCAPDHLDRTRSTRIGSRPTPPNLFPLSLFDERPVAPSQSFLEKRSEMHSVRLDSPGGWFKNNLPAGASLKNVKRAPLFF